MALSKEEKEALNDHFKGKDLYDPSKAPEQEVTTFAPKGMNCGGMAEGEGYAEGGEIDLGNPEVFEPSSFDAPILSAATDTARGAVAPPPPTMELPRLPAPIAAPAAPGGASKPATAVMATKAAPMAAPGAGKMAPDEYSELVKYLGEKPSFGQSAMSGLAGLADAIETGIARAGSSGFQKGIDERGQNQKANLINALKAKYEAGAGARGMTESERHNKAAEGISNKEMEARLSESKAALQQNALEAMGRLSASGGITSRVLGQPDDARAAIDALAQRAGLAGTQTKVPTITTKAEYAALPKGTHYQDANGKQGIKK